MNKSGIMTLAIATAVATSAILPAPAAVSALPEGYTRLEWIAADGNQRIDTDYRPDQTDKISVRFKMPTYSSAIQTLFCARQNGTDTFTCLILTNGRLRFDYNTGTVGTTPAGLARDVDYILVADGKTMTYTLNGNAVTLSDYTDRSGTFTPGSTLRLFQTEGGALPGHYRMYWFKVEDESGNVKVDMRPCKRDSDGAIGMYDLVRESFLPNVSTGVFETNDTRLPSGYSAREWIQSSGSQWIDTQFTPLCFDTATARFQFRALPNENLAVFCARNTSNKQTFTCLRIYNQSANKKYFRFDRNEGTGTGGESAFNPTLETDYTVVMNGTTRDCTLNDRSIATAGTEGNFTVGSQFSLFAAHSGTTLSDANMTMKSSLRLYGFTVTDSATGTILCDLLPCVRRADNKPGLYDRVNMRFLVNGGTGEFKVPVVATFVTFR